MKKVTKIAQNTAEITERPKLRVAAYCRVSTDSDEQRVSLETQIKHYESYIGANPEWEFAGLYYDEGITGTKKEKRPELLRMIADCEQKKIDFIVTKSISRFARNTTDCLELVRKLIRLGTFIYFEKENINTGSMDSELMLSILSGLAESESVSIAQNNKWAIQKRFQNGTYKIGSSPYGYDAVDGELIVNQAQAEIVRFISAAILSGKGTCSIASELNRSGLTGKHGGRWKSSTIRGMIRNEKYTGDAIFQKTYTDEHFNRHHNNGEKDQYLIKEHHEPIISREDFEAAQIAIEQRGKEKNVEKRSKKYQNRYPFSGNIICGQCGGTFKRRIHSSGKKYIAWCCSTHIANIEKCAMKYILDSDLEYAFIAMMNKLIFGHKLVLKPLLASLRGMNNRDSRTSIKELEKKLNENADQRKVLVGLMTKGYLDPAVYNKSNNELLQEAERLQRQKESFVRFLSSDSRYLNEVSELLHFTSKAAMLTSFDGELYSRFVERIRVISRTEIGFELRCGLTLKERMVN
ncbi:resolvase [Brevibacillus reuszeri]|uniref:Recombinase n=1 Tax=Brevibacillus reuszeri TaxID=54915 RepID=A0A0K9Z1P5_9BACL|nr:recombinase family protein [Brevibacillus reuszeri]KNB74375.1 recombinase [Brevibacillus reuszeri]MED1856282.1 recombinase family protein [Brevibacillus reuszeri]GED68029.1 resolvase [Brevibacillus reuszeri]